jgi:hypothetical protein
MCGNIKKLRFPDRPATPAEVDAAVLQFVRKISNVRKPSEENREAFDAALAKIAGSVQTMLDGLVVRRTAALATATFEAVGEKPKKVRVFPPKKKKGE